MNVLLKEKVKLILVSVAIITLGIVFCAVPEKSLNVLEIVLASLLIFWGVINIFGFCFAPEFARDGSILFVGFLCTLLGVMLLFVPSSLMLGIGIISGIWGIRRIGGSIDAKTLGDKCWWQDLIFGISIFVLSLLLIIFRCTSLAISAVMIYLGSTLIVWGIMSLVFYFVLKRRVKYVKSLFEIFGKKKTSEDNIDGDNDEGDDGTEDFTDYKVE